jgi:hypothetical protein
MEEAASRDRKFLGLSLLRHPRLPFAIASSLALLLGVTSVLLWIHCLNIQKQALPPWPLSTLLSDEHTAQIVIADSNYSILRLSNNQHSSMNDYLSSELMRNQTSAHGDSPENRIGSYIARSLLTSYADAFVATSITKLAGSKSSQLTIRSARDLRPRDLEQNNFIFVGSPTSNPWVSLYADQLNFQEVEENIGQQKYFRNRSPKSGEQAIYRGLDHTGAAGTDYATISFLRSTDGGNVLIIQGLQQEGTEAAGLFLAEESGRRQIRKTLHIPDSQNTPVYFEVLLSTTTVNGAPGEISIVAARLLK